MEKLMILAAAVIVTVVANAAAVNWKSGTVAMPSGAAVGKNDVTAYLFNVDLATYSTYAAYTDAAKLSTDIYAAYKDSLGSADATKASSAKGAANLSDGVEYGVGTYYALILYTAKESSKDYFMGNFAAATIEAAQDVDVSDLALKMGGTGAATSWQTAAVPEPTSGLLLLLGMAGLALKRKRA